MFFIIHCAVFLSPFQPSPASFTLTNASSTFKAVQNASATFLYESTGTLAGRSYSQKLANVMVFGGPDATGTGSPTLNILQVSANDSDWATSHPWVTTLGLTKQPVDTIFGIEDIGTFSTATSYMYTFGGMEGGVFSDTARRWDPGSHPSPAWLPTSSIGPGPRSTAGVIFNDTFYIFGGYNGSTCLGDTWAFAVVPGRWAPEITYAANSTYDYPPARCDHTVTLVKGTNQFGIGSFLLMAGGRTDSGEALDDVWILDFATLKWERIYSPSLPMFSARYGAALMAHPHLPIAFLMGGVNDTVVTDLWVLDFTAPMLPPSAIPISPPPVVTVSPPSPPPTTPSCTSDSPGPSFVCVYGQWVATGDVTVTTVSLSGNEQIVVVNGSLTVSGGITLHGVQSSLSAQNGCITIGGTVELQLTQEEITQLEKEGKTGKTITIAQQSSDCANSLSTTPVKASSTSSGCKKVRSSSSDSSSQSELLVTLFVDKAACNTRWIIIGCTLGVLLIVAAIVVTAIVVRKRSSGRSRAMMNSE